MAYEKDDLTIRNYHVYLLPHANGTDKPKVGISSQTPNRRKSQNKADGYDVEGHQIIEWLQCTRAEAEAIEKQYQIQYNCIDGYTDRWKINVSLSLKGRPSPNRGKAMPIEKCIHCGKEASPGNIKRWHGDNCPHKQ